MQTVVMHTTHYTRLQTRLRTACADYVCWVDYLPDRVYSFYVKVPGAYKLYKWAERHQ